MVEYSNGTFKAYTLGARPLSEVVAGLREGATALNIMTIGSYTLSNPVGTGSSHMEIAITLSNFAGPTVLTVASSPGGQERTTIYFDSSSYTISVDRSHSSTVEVFANTSVVGFFYPYTVASTDDLVHNRTASNNTTDSGCITEDLVMHVYLDGSLLEVLVNVSHSPAFTPIDKR